MQNIFSVWVVAVNFWQSSKRCWDVHEWTLRIKHWVYYLYKSELINNKNTSIWCKVIAECKHDFHHIDIICNLMRNV